ncbi:hypothetical protein [Nocardia jiangxiensis]|uniref:hypothetical protein n=1 Tax=Nocardia jiangxiensis TaxID=282685 RepID=UPI00031A42B4|nr:hypothetical protein [Nocardia jiangxiensis]
MKTGEHSERGRYVTEQVALWIANEGDATFYKGTNDRIAFIAARHAWDGELDALARFATHLIRTAQPAHAAWQVQQELAPNDYDRIRWEDVAAELKATFDKEGLN